MNLSYFMWNLDADDNELRFVRLGIVHNTSCQCFLVLFPVAILIFSIMLPANREEDYFQPNRKCSSAKPNTTNLKDLFSSDLLKVQSI